MKEKVLLVDDEMVLSLNTRAVLEDGGYHANVVTSAEQCLDLLETGEETPDIILMDIDFGPNHIDGSEATKLINERYDIPVVLYSAYTDKETIDKTREMTRYGYIQKNPGNEQLILATIEMALKLHQMEQREREHKERLCREITLKDKITQTAPVGIIVADAEGDIVFANREAKRVFDLEDESGGGIEPSRRWKVTEVGGGTLPGPALPFEDVRRSRSSLRDVRRAVHRPDGRTLYLSINAAPLTNEKESFSGMVAAVRDVTKEHLQNIRMEKVHRVLKMLIETNKYLVRIDDERELLDKICRVIAENGGYPLVWVGYASTDEKKWVEPAVSAGEERDCPLKMCISTGENAYENSTVDRALRNGTVEVDPDIGREPSSDPMTAELCSRGCTCSVSIPLFVSRSLVGVLNICCRAGHQIEEEELELFRQLADDISFGLSHLRNREKRRAAEKELRAGEQRYRELLNHLQHVREEQLAHLALEIHDDLGQSLTALTMNCTALERELCRQVPEVLAGKIGNTLHEMKAILAGTAFKTRELVQELRPTVLETEGLVEALKWQAEEFGRLSGVQVVFHSSAEEVELSDKRALAVYRIVQESFTNIVRHSNARNVCVKTFVFEDSFCIEITDDGSGFEEQEERTDGTSRSSFGLLGMYERAEFCGGQVEVDSTPGEGTRISLSIPLQEH
jgi:signal transduction histidine kinase/CheY-like chemotaxis protein